MSALTPMSQPSLDAYVETLRRAFPFYRNEATRGLAYLNSAAMALRPDAVIEAVRPTMENPLVIGDELETARRILSRHFRVPRENLYALMGSHMAFERIFSLLARHGNLRVLLTDLEHKAVTNPLDHLERQGRLVREYVRLDAIGRVDVGDLRDRLTPETTAVVLTHVSNATGTIQPLRVIASSIASFNEETGSSVLLLVDGPQAVPRMPVDLAVADVYCFAQQKSFCLPGSVLYLSDAAKRAISGQEDPGARDRFLDELLVAGTEHAEAIVSYAAATRFIAGLPPLRPGGGDGVSAASEVVRSLRDAVFRGLASIPGIRILGAEPDRLDENAGIVLFQKEGRPTGDLAARLHEKGIIVRAGTLDRFGHYFCVPRAARLLPELERGGGAIRVSLALYNDNRDLERLRHVLESA